MRSSERPESSGRVLLATTTGEPLQPVRLYWSIPTRASVSRVLTALRCVVEDPRPRTWVWLYQDEAAALTFGKPYGELPPDIHPVHIGRFRMPDKDRLVMECRSFERAIQAAKFFGPILGADVVLRRVRVLNRWLDAEERHGGLKQVDRLLDRDVVKIDPRDAEEAFDKAMAGATTDAERSRRFERHSAERRKRDVPLVEDFPLAPEEETAEFRDLTMTLQFRAVRASEHWRGNTHLTLSAIIHRMVERGVQDGTITVPPGLGELA